MALTLNCIADIVTSSVNKIASEVQEKLRYLSADLPFYLTNRQGRSPVVDEAGGIPNHISPKTAKRCLVTILHR